MITIGLTGSIGMGKSTIAAQCASLGAHTINADDIVHMLMQPRGAAFDAIAKTFPDAVKDGMIDRRILGSIVFPDAKKLRALEKILHPLVVAEEEKFAARAKKKGAAWAVFDIPLLFETGAQTRFDYTLVATAPSKIQKERVLARPTMTPEKFKAILAKQMPDKQKQRRADFIVHTNHGLDSSLAQLKTMMGLIGIPEATITKT